MTFITTRLEAISFRLLRGDAGQMRAGALCSPYMRSIDMIAISERYRIKALTCEKFSLDATDRTIKTAWTEIAIEWHTLSNRAAQQYERDQ
jgi:hypothetical protein